MHWSVGAPSTSHAMGVLHTPDPSNACLLKSAMISMRHSCAGVQFHHVLSSLMLTHGTRSMLCLHKKCAQEAPKAHTHTRTHTHTHAHARARTHADTHAFQHAKGAHTQMLIGTPTRTPHPHLIPQTSHLCSAAGWGPCTRPAARPAGIGG